MRKTLVTRARADREEYRKQIGLMSVLCVEIAGLHQARHDVKSALGFYEEALKNDRSNVPRAVGAVQDEAQLWGHRRVPAVVL
jgi:hypothetical protein